MANVFGLGAKVKTGGEVDSQSAIPGSVEAAEEAVRTVGAELARARQELEAASEAAVKAEADYDVAVRQNYDGLVPDAKLELAQSARTSASGAIDRLGRIIKLLEERLELRREEASKARRRVADRLVESACAEVAQLFLRFLDKKAEADAVRLEMGRRFAQAQAEIQRLGGDPNKIVVNYEALQKSWAEKRGL